jgi:hypothetical protein
MMGRGVWLVAAAAVVAALVVFAVWLTAVVARPSKPLVPITNGTFTASYNATVICVDGRKTWDLTLVYRNGKLIRAMLDGREIPLAVFKYPHGLNYIGELLLDLNRIEEVNNETLKPLGGISTSVSDVLCLMPTRRLRPAPIYSSRRASTTLGW